MLVTRSSITLVKKVQIKVLVDFILGPTTVSTQYNTPSMPQGNLKERDPIVIGHGGDEHHSGKKRQ